MKYSAEERAVLTALWMGAYLRMLGEIKCIAFCRCPEHTNIRERRK